MEAMEVDNFEEVLKENESLDKTTDFSSLGFGALNALDGNIGKETPMDIPVEGNHHEPHLEKSDSPMSLENHSNGIPTPEDKLSENELENSENSKGNGVVPEDAVDESSTETVLDQKSKGAEEGSKKGELSENDKIPEKLQDTETAEESEEAHRSDDKEHKSEHEEAAKKTKNTEGNNKNNLISGNSSAPNGAEELNAETENHNMSATDSNSNAVGAEFESLSKQRRLSRKEDTSISEDESGNDSPRKLSSRVRKKPEKFESEELEPSPKRISPTKKRDSEKSTEESRTPERRARQNLSPGEPDDSICDSNSVTPLSKTDSPKKSSSKKAEEGPNIAEDKIGSELKRKRTKRSTSDVESKSKTKRSSEKDSDIESMSSSPGKKKNEKRKKACESESENSPRQKRVKRSANSGWEDHSRIQVLSPEEAQALNISPVVTLHKVKNFDTHQEDVEGNGTTTKTKHTDGKKQTVCKEESKPECGTLSKKNCGTKKKLRQPVNKGKSSSVHDDKTLISLKKKVLKAGLRIRNYEKFWAGCKSRSAKIAKLKDYLTEHGLGASDLEDEHSSKINEEKKSISVSEADQIGFIKIEVLRGQTQSAIRSVLAAVCGESALLASQISAIIRRFKSCRVSAKALKVFAKKRELAKEFSELNTDVILPSKTRSFRSGRGSSNDNSGNSASSNFTTAHAEINAQSNSSITNFNSRDENTSERMRKRNTSGTELNTKSRKRAKVKVLNSYSESESNGEVSDSDSPCDAATVSETSFINITTLKNKEHGKDSNADPDSKLDRRPLVSKVKSNSYVQEGSSKTKENGKDKDFNFDSDSEAESKSTSKRRQTSKSKKHGQGSGSDSDSKADDKPLVSKIKSNPYVQEGSPKIKKNGKDSDFNSESDSEAELKSTSKRRQTSKSKKHGKGSDSDSDSKADDKPLVSKIKSNPYVQEGSSKIKKNGKDSDFNSESDSEAELKSTSKRRQTSKSKKHEKGSDSDSDSKSDDEPLVSKIKSNPCVQEGSSKIEKNGKDSDFNSESDSEAELKSTLKRRQTSKSKKHGKASDSDSDSKSDDEPLVSKIKSNSYVQKGSSKTKKNGKDSDFNSDSDSEAESKSTLKRRQTSISKKHRKASDSDSDSKANDEPLVSKIKSNSYVQKGSSKNMENGKDDSDSNSDDEPLVYNVKSNLGIKLGQLENTKNRKVSKFSPESDSEAQFKSAVKSKGTLNAKNYRKDSDFDAKPVDKVNRKTPKRKEKEKVAECDFQSEKEIDFDDKHKSNVIGSEAKKPQKKVKSPESNLQSQCDCNSSYEEIKRKPKLKFKMEENVGNKDSREENASKSMSGRSVKSNENTCELLLEDSLKENQSHYQAFQSSLIEKSRASQEEKVNILKDNLDANLVSDPRSKSELRMEEIESSKKLRIASDTLSNKNIEQLLDGSYSESEECDD